MGKPNLACSTLYFSNNNEDLELDIGQDEKVAWQFQIAYFSN